MLHLKVVHHFLHVKQKYVFIDEANHIYIAILTYNLIWYSDSYSDTSGSLWQFKRDKPPTDNDGLGVYDNDNFNSQSFKYKTALAGKTSGYINPNSFVKYTKIVVPLKYLKIIRSFLKIIRNAMNQLQNSSWIKLDWRLHYKI